MGLGSVPLSEIEAPQAIQQTVEAQQETVQTDLLPTHLVSLEDESVSGSDEDIEVQSSEPVEAEAVADTEAPTTEAEVVEAVDPRLEIKQGHDEALRPVRNFIGLLSFSRGGQRPR